MKMAGGAMRRTLRRGLSALAVPLAMLVALMAAPHGTATGAAMVAQAGAAPAGDVYVNDNIAGTNSVAGLARAADGSLTPLPGSPFSIGCCGSGASLGSQGALQVSGDGQFLLAVNAASDSIAVARIAADGSLTPVAGSPFASGGMHPVSIAVHGQLVYVANAGDGGSNYSGFSLGTDGSLQPLANSTVMVPDGASLGDVLFNADGTRLVGTRVTPSTIDSFAVDPTGHLTAAPGAPFKAEGEGPLGSAFLPTGGTQLFVSNAHDGAGKGSVSAFTVAADGTLQAASGSPYADQETAPCWVAISPDGKYLFAVNTMSDSVSAYDIAADGTLTLEGSKALRGGPKLGAVDLGLDPLGHTLYVVDSQRNMLSALSVNGDTLTELSSSPVALPAGSTPFGLAVR